MYKGVQKRYWAIVATLLLGCMLIACGDSALEESADATDCPEGYVYDYQVSMEPIPEEIAALGGPCQGTIHAYPSRIAMALTELQMEEDPVLKAEVEKRIPEIEAALEEEIGGDFVVDGVILMDPLFWVFICTETATGYQFDLDYGNKEYYAELNNLTLSENVISVKDYYKGEDSIVLSEDLSPIIKKYYEDSDYTVSAQLEVDTIDIIMVQYTKNGIEKYAEQEKLLQLWEELQIYNDELYYNLYIFFCPPEYEQVMEEKINSTIRYDFGLNGDEEGTLSLIENHEIWNFLYYDGRGFAENENNLNVLLQQYQTGTYDNTVVWDYWVE